MSKTSSTTTKISSFVLMIIFITLALSLTALTLAITAYSTGQVEYATYLLLIGFLGVAFSTYVLLQTKRRILGLKIEIPQVTTTIECRKCGFKSIREFQRGDYIFKMVEPCQKCNENMLITAIYKEVREREKSAFPF
jgi:multidrug transporter EmrE-like cation transporter